MNRQKASMAVIKLARRLAANTPIQKLPLTTFLYRKVFRFGYREDELTISFRGVTLTIPSKDTTIVPGLVGGFYEEIELDIFECLAKESTTIIDVGGSIGDYTCVGAANLPADGKLIVFEPVPENIGYIQKNVVQNGLTEKVVIEPKAAGDSVGELTIHLVEGSVGTHTAGTTNNEATISGSITVPIVSMDSYLAEHKLKSIDILKIDVEGYDGFVLRGAKNILVNDKPTLFVEFVPDHLTKCGFLPDEFLDIIFGAYEHIFFVDEPRSTISRCNRDDLRSSHDSYKNANIIAVSRPNHIEIVRQMVKR